MSEADGAAGYVALIQAAIDRERDILGADEAVSQAESIDGLVLDDGGSVIELQRDGKAVLRDLVDAYVGATGDVAAFLIARRIENMSDQGVDLPENLAKHL